MVRRFPSHILLDSMAIAKVSRKRELGSYSFVESAVFPTMQIDVCCSLHNSKEGWVNDSCHPLVALRIWGWYSILDVPNVLKIHFYDKQFQRSFVSLAINICCILFLFYIVWPILVLFFLCCITLWSFCSIFPDFFTSVMKNTRKGTCFYLSYLTYAISHIINVV